MHLFSQLLHVVFSLGQSCIKSCDSRRGLCVLWYWLQLKWKTMKVWRLCVVSLSPNKGVDCESDFPVHSLTCFLYLKPGSLRGLHSDWVCRCLMPRWGGACSIWVYCHLCVCVHAFGEAMFTYRFMYTDQCFILGTCLKMWHILNFLNSN